MYEITLRKIAGHTRSRIATILQCYEDPAQIGNKEFWRARRDSNPGRWLGRPMDAQTQCPRPGLSSSCFFGQPGPSRRIFSFDLAASIRRSASDPILSMVIGASNYQLTLCRCTYIAVTLTGLG